jgi:hypothetical protein
MDVSSTPCDDSNHNMSSEDELERVNLQLNQMLLTHSVVTPFGFTFFFLYLLLTVTLFDCSSLSRVIFVFFFQPLKISLLKVRPWTEDDLQLFHDIGWVHNVPLSQVKRHPLSEESLRHCDIVNDPSFLTRWVAEQVIYFFPFSVLLSFPLPIFNRHSRIQQCFSLNLSSILMGSFACSLSGYPIFLPSSSFITFIAVATLPPSILTSPSEF